jgi:predicted aspartyl protease
MTQLTRRLILGALPGLGLAGHALAQLPSGMRVTPPPEEDVDYLLDAWVDAYGRPTAKVMINGMGPFQFMVDTGATTTVIAARHLTTLGTKPLGQVTVVGTTGTASMPLVRLDKLQTGAVTKPDLDVAVLPDSELAGEDGILGGDVFVGRRLVFDIRGKSVRLEPSKRQVRATTLGNMRVRNGLLAEIDGRVGSVAARLMLDTGAQNCIANMALSDALLKHHPKLQRLNNARIFGVTGHKVVGQYIALPKVDLRAFTVRDAGCVAADAQIFDQWDMNREPAMIVGVNLLSRLESFSIDYGAEMFDAKLLAELLARNPAAFG